jgi:nucleoside-diphosphate-sugar epimerase
MNILVSGCSSSIGKKIIPQLFSAGHTVVGLRKGNCADARFHKCISVDLLNVKELKRLGEISAELLILLAWETTPKTFWNDAVNFQWQEMSLRIVEIFQGTGGRKVLGIGTCAEYSWNTISPLKETDETVPVTKYGQAKLATLKGIEGIGIDFIWVRVFFMFGASDPRGKLLVDLIESCDSQDSYVLSNPKNQLDFINVNDVVTVLCAIIESKTSGVYNVGNGIGYVVEDVAKEIFRQMDSEIELTDSAGIKTQSTVIANIDKLKALIGFQRIKPLELLIEELLIERSNSVGQ